MLAKIIFLSSSCTHSSIGIDSVAAPSLLGGALPSIGSPSMLAKMIFLSSSCTHSSIGIDLVAAPSLLGGALPSIASLTCRLVLACPVVIEEGWQVDIPVILPAIHKLGNHSLEHHVELLNLSLSLEMVEHCILPLDSPLPGQLTI